MFASMLLAKRMVARSLCPPRIGSRAGQQTQTAGLNTHSKCARLQDQLYYLTLGCGIEHGMTAVAQYIRLTCVLYCSPERNVSGADRMALLNIVAPCTVPKFKKRRSKWVESQFAESVVAGQLDPRQAKEIEQLCIGSLDK